MSIVDDLNKINKIKNEIKQVIREKGVEMKDDTPFADYPSRIRDIETGDLFYEDFYNIKTENNTYYARLFSDYTGTELDVSSLDTSNVTNMHWMFFGCNNLTKLDVSNFNTINVTNMGGMFQECSNLTELYLKGFNTINVEDMNMMFMGCNNLETLDLGNWIINDYTYIHNMFMGCDNLHILYLVGCSNETISKIINDSNLPTGTWGLEMKMRVIYCSEKDRGDLEAPDGWEFSYKEEDPEDPNDPKDPENPEDPKDIPLYVPGEFQDNTEITEVRTMVDESHDDLSDMFYGCSNLVSVNTEDWDTSNVATMACMFHNCESLTLLDLSNFDTSNVTDMDAMFAYSNSLTSLDLSNFITSNVTNMNSMFYNCTNLTSLDIRNWDTSSIEDNEYFDSFLGMCDNLRELHLDNCNNNTISMIINESSFPRGAMTGAIRTIYCKESEAAGFTAPDGWVFSYVD